MTIEQARRALVGYVPQQIDAPEAKPAAVAVILMEQAPTREIAALFIKRAARRDDPWSGQVAFPGGRREAEDPDLLATAIRETREEIGVDLAGAERLVVLDDLYPRTPTLPPVLVRPYVFAVPDAPRLVLSDEVARAFWVTLAGLRDPQVRREVKLQLRGVERVFPAYDLGDDVIWGMTERILTPFLDRIGLGP